MKTVDFIPQWYRIQLQSLRNRRRRLVSLGVMCLLMLCWFLSNEARIQKAEAHLRMAHDGNQRTRLLEERLVKLEHQKASLLELKRRYDALSQEMVPSIIFAEISHCLPEDASLIDFRLGARDPQAQTKDRRASRRRARASVADSDQCVGLGVVLRVQAPERDALYEFIENLKDSPLFEDLHTSGTEVLNVADVVVKEKQITFSVLSAECIGP